MAKGGKGQERSGFVDKKCAQFVGMDAILLEKLILHRCAVDIRKGIKIHGR